MMTIKERDDLRCQVGTSNLANSKSQIVTSNWGGSRVPPYAFSEQGVAMLSSVLRSSRAVQVNTAERSWLSLFWIPLVIVDLRSIANLFA